MMAGKDLTLLLGCYLVGCFTAGYYWVRWRTGQDIRFVGSGNVGARNVGRVSGRSGFFGTFLIDLAKGYLAVAGSRYFGAGETALIFAAFAVVAGHNWPVQLRFQGGKGISTSLGALLAFNSGIVALMLLFFLPVYGILRNFTLSGLFAFMLAPLMAFLAGLDNGTVFVTSLLGITILITHRKNIRDELTRLTLGRPLKTTEAAASRSRRGFYP